VEAIGKMMSPAGLRDENIRNTKIALSYYSLYLLFFSLDRKERKDQETSKAIHPPVWTQARRAFIPHAHI
jgi:hypothetical protein